MSEDEARVAIYCQCLTILERGDKEQVPQFWNPAADDLSNEHFLSALGLSPAYPQGRDFYMLKALDHYSLFRGSLNLFRYFCSYCSPGIERGDAKATDRQPEGRRRVTTKSLEP